MEYELDALLKYMKGMKIECLDEIFLIFGRQDLTTYVSDNAAHSINKTTEKIEKGYILSSQKRLPQIH